MEISRELYTGRNLHKEDENPNKMCKPTVLDEIDVVYGPWIGGA